MKLLKCHIENFGKLSNLNFDFQNGLNTLKHENGWGKTTFSEFLCAIFYGIPDKNTRKKYQPWQGGNYGGFAEFELSDGKCYRVERYFKKSSTKANPDEFKLIDLQTYTESDRFSSNLGLELFEINAAGYLRSAFINKKKLYDDADEKLSDSNGTGSVSARLGGLLEDADDIGSYDSAIAALDEKRRYFIADRGSNGKIDTTAAELAETERAIESAKSLMESAKREEEQIALLDSTAKTLEAEEKELEEAQRLAGLKSLSNQYKKDCEALEAERKNAEECRAFFKGKAPEKSETDRISNEIVNLEHEKHILNGAKPSDADIEREKLLSQKKYPDGDEADLLRDIILKLEIADKKLEEYSIPADKMDRLTQLKLEFANGVPGKKEIEALNLALDNYQTALAYMTFTKEQLDAERQKPGTVVVKQAPTVSKKVKAKYRRLTVLSECVSGFGIAMTVIGFMMGLAGLWIPGIALMVLGFIGAMKYDSKAPASTNTAVININADDIEKKYNEKVAECARCKEILDQMLSAYVLSDSDGYYKNKIARITEDVHEHDSIVRELRELESNHNKLLDSCDEYRAKLVPILGDCENGKFRASLEQLIKERTELESLREKLKEITDKSKISSDKIEQYKHELNEIFAQWFELTDNCNYSVMLRELNDRIQALNTADGKVTMYADRCRETAEAHPDIATVNTDEEMLDIENAEEKLKELRTELTQKRDELLKLSNQVNEMYNSAANLPELEAKYDSLYENLETYKKQHKAIENALKYLEEAKNNLSVRYLRQMNRSFTDYIGRLSDSTGIEFRVDRNLNVKFDEVGKEREANSLSDGWRDLVGFCTRLSLIKALFPNEKPVLIVDDPFANLDNRRLTAGKQMLEELGSDYQIVYFTCADERA